MGTAKSGEWLELELGDTVSMLNVEQQVSYVGIHMILFFSLSSMASCDW